MHTYVNRLGFTLIEFMLVIALLVLVLGISAPVYEIFVRRNGLDIATLTVVQSLRRAQLLSEAVADDSSWGVFLQPESITLFSGASYQLRDPDFDESFDLPASVTLSEVDEVVFAKQSGQPQTIGSIVLTLNAYETRTITINAEGTVSY